MKNEEDEETYSPDMIRFKYFMKFSENFSTHLLTWLTNGAILKPKERNTDKTAHNNGVVSETQ